MMGIIWMSYSMPTVSAVFTKQVNQRAGVGEINERMWIFNNFWNEAAMSFRLELVQTGEIRIQKVADRSYFVCDWHFFSFDLTAQVVFSWSNSHAYSVTVTWDKMVNTVRYHSSYWTKHGLDGSGAINETSGQIMEVAKSEQSVERTSGSN